MAGVCYNANIENDEKNYKRGMDCIKSMHGRTTEFPDVYMVLDDYSARVIREFYTHIGGAPTRLQASTRYIDYEKGAVSVMVINMQGQIVATFTMEGQRTIDVSCWPAGVYTVQMLGGSLVTKKLVVE